MISFGLDSIIESVVVMLYNRLIIVLSNLHICGLFSMQRKEQLNLAFTCQDDRLLFHYDEC